MKARNRIIQPEFFQNKILSNMKTHARLLFIGLWQLADREGLLLNNPDLIKGFLFPYEKVSVENLLKSLASKGFIVLYSVQEIAYIWIPKFKIHQPIHKHETQSVIPLPDDVIKCQDNVDTCSDNVDTCPAPITSSSSSSFTSTKSGKPDDIPYEEIISYLNEKTGKNFQQDKETNRKWVRLRWQDGYRVPDFKRVVDNKCPDWLNDEENDKYLQPSTLFGNKFEGYLNQRSAQAPPEKTADQLYVEREHEAQRKAGLRE